MPSKNQSNCQASIVDEHSHDPLSFETGTLTDDLIAKAEALKGDDRGPDGSFAAKLNAVGAIAAAIGYNNVFNDLTNAEIEGGWIKAATGAGFDAGRRGASDDNPDNLDHELPAGGLSIPELVMRYKHKAVTTGNMPRRRSASVQTLSTPIAKGIALLKLICMPICWARARWARYQVNSNISWRRSRPSPAATTRLQPSKRSKPIARLVAAIG